jgi:hypothetical protein
VISVGIDELEEGAIDPLGWGTQDAPLSLG